MQASLNVPPHLKYRSLLLIGQYCCLEFECAFLKCKKYAELKPLKIHLASVHDWTPLAVQALDQLYKTSCKLREYMGFFCTHVQCHVTLRQQTEMGYKQVIKHYNDPQYRETHCTGTDGADVRHIQFMAVHRTMSTRSVTGKWKFFDFPIDNALEALDGLVQELEIKRARNRYMLHCLNRSIQQTEHHMPVFPAHVPELHSSVSLEIDHFLSRIKEETRLDDDVSEMLQGAILIYIYRDTMISRALSHVCSSSEKAYNSTIQGTLKRSLNRNGHHWTVIGLEKDKLYVSDIINAIDFRIISINHAICYILRLQNLPSGIKPLVEQLRDILSRAAGLLRQPRQHDTWSAEDLTGYLFRLQTDFAQVCSISNSIVKQKELKLNAWSVATHPLTPPGISHVDLFHPEHPRSDLVSFDFPSYPLCHQRAAEAKASPGSSCFMCTKTASEETHCIRAHFQRKHGDSSWLSVFGDEFEKVMKTCQDSTVAKDIQTSTEDPKAAHDRRTLNRNEELYNFVSEAKQKLSPALTVTHDAQSDPNLRFLERFLNHRGSKELETGHIDLHGYDADTELLAVLAAIYIPYRFTLVARNLRHLNQAIEFLRTRQLLRYPTSPLDIHHIVYPTSEVTIEISHLSSAIDTLMGRCTIRMAILFGTAQTLLETVRMDHSERIGFGALDNVYRQLARIYRQTHNRLARNARSWHYSKYHHHDYHTQVEGHITSLMQIIRQLLLKLETAQQHNQKAHQHYLHHGM